MFKFAKLTTSDLNGRELELGFSIRSTPVAQRWAESLFQANTNSAIFERSRWYNFPGHRNNSVAEITSQIEKSIGVINNTFPGLIEGIRPEESVQESVNRIHSHFADTNLQKAYVTEHTWVAWNDLNNALHSYESYLRSKEIENDDIASDEHILPLQRLSANTYFWFGPTTSKNSLASLEQAIENWFSGHQERLNRLGFHWGDPQLAIGWIPVGDIIGPYENLENQLALVNELGKMSETSSFIPKVKMVASSALE